jgi:predicted DNA-binding transcriptional regulator AlpA
MISTKKAPATQVECATKAAMAAATAAKHNVDAEAERSATRLISKQEVLRRVGVTFPTLWAWMRAGKFPRSRELGGKAAWVEAEIEAWITGLPEREYKGDEQRRRVGRGRES